MCFILDFMSKASLEKAELYIELDLTPIIGMSLDMYIYMYKCVHIYSDV